MLGGMIACDAMHLGTCELNIGRRLVPVVFMFNAVCLPHHTQC